METKQEKTRLIFSTYDDIHNPFYGGGGAIAVHKIAKLLSEKYDVTVLSWDYCGKKREKIDGVQYERFGFSFLNSKIGMLLYQWMLPYQMLTRKFDIFFESFCPPFTTALLPLFTKKNIVGVVHMLAAQDMERKYKLPFRYIERFGIKQYKRIIVTSDHMSDTIHAIARDAEITVISNGIDKVYDTIAHSKKYILFLGRIEIDQKGLDLLVTAFKKFNEKKNSMYKLFITGTGEKTEMQKLKQLIAEQGIKEQVEFTGKVVGENKVNLLRRAACVVVPSRFETYSIVSLEALAHKTPLVCFAIDGLSWLSHQVAFKVKPYDTTAFADAMETATSDNKLQKKLDKGSDFAKQYTWENIYNQYEDYIQKMIAK